MSRKQLDHFLEQERRIKLGASITRFAISAEGVSGSDEKQILRNQAQSTANEPETKGPNETSTQFLRGILSRVAF
jgi:hypothetical protein